MASYLIIFIYYLFKKKKLKANCEALNNYTNWLKSYTLYLKTFYKCFKHKFNEAHYEDSSSTHWYVWTLLLRETAFTLIP